MLTVSGTTSFVSSTTLLKAGLVMKFANLTLVCCLFCLLSLGVSAQDDPFGGDDSDQSSDPFAVSGQEKGSDPFGTAGKESNSDPFAVDLPEMAIRRPRSKTVSVKIDSSEAINRIRLALDHSTTQSFNETPLVEVVRELAETHKIRILVDGRALEEAGFSEEEPITIGLKDVSLRSFLRLMLRSMGLTYAARDEVLVITTREAAERNLQLRTYRLNSSLSGNCEEVIAAIQKTVEPKAWSGDGGSASITSVLNDVIIVSATESLHERVQDFFEKVDAALAQ